MLDLKRFQTYVESAAFAQKYARKKMEKGGLTLTNNTTNKSSFFILSQEDYCGVKDKLLYNKSIVQFSTLGTRVYAKQFFARLNSG